MMISEIEKKMEKTGLIPSHDILSWLGSLSEIDAMPRDTQLLTRGAILGNIYEIHLQMQYHGHYIETGYFLKFEEKYFKIWT